MLFVVEATRPVRPPTKALSVTVPFSTLAPTPIMPVYERGVCPPPICPICIVCEVGAVHRHTALTKPATPAQLVFGGATRTNTQYEFLPQTTASHACSAM